IAGLAGAFVGVRYIQPRISTTTQSTPTRKIEIINHDELFVDVVEQTREAVVSIIITQDLPVYENYYSNPFGRGFGFPSRRQVGEEEQQIGAGSGFIVSSDGYIVTNKHVVDSDGASYTVILNNGEQMDAEVVDTDAFLDIAVLKIEGNDLPFLDLGNSDDVRVGQQVLAIGNTLGEFTNTVSSGIVSGQFRSIVAGSSTGDSELLSDLIQTDASISSGNSGGPLINLKGEVIGVNVAVSQAGENIGFAIPINPVNQIVESVKENGKIIRPYLGVRYMEINEVIREQNNLQYDYGALLIRGQDPTDLAVMPGSPADKAGLVENDIILEVNGVALEGTSLQSQIQKYAIGETIELLVASKGEEKKIEIVLEGFDQ
ncbi:trypsin-like peptidase domain-containing protein, partial [Candidatus Dojkabacteria bacterium]|nr:trypsin-like peptidase domain-containing protein [Candidatus Dojkabacteria bacterium]